MPGAAMSSGAIPALVPDTQGGHQFVLYGDCCSGVPGTPHARNFARVNAALLRLYPRPDFICFLGDHIAGLTRDAAALREQWRYFLDDEFLAVRRAVPACWHVTSNHSIYDQTSLATWREIFPDLPGNGPPHERGLAYWVRRGTLLLVVMNTACVERQGRAGVASEWLDEILTAHADARHKLVIGHHPIHPVNGYDEYPRWRVPPEEGARFWDTLVRHGVLAYACSHIIAFDTQAHRGVLQITTGGAGTEWGPGGGMPRPPEYLHFVQVAVDDRGLALQTRDPAGALRDWLAWPPQEGNPGGRLTEPLTGHSVAVPPPAAWEAPVGTSHLLVWQFSGWLSLPHVAARILLRATTDDGTQGFIIAMEHGAVVVHQFRTVDHGAGAAESTATWFGPAIGNTANVGIDIAIHTGMGPGGVLWRSSPHCRWSSMRSSSAIGFESFPWCGRWQIGSKGAPADGSHVVAWRAALQRLSCGNQTTPP